MFINIVTGKIIITGSIKGNSSVKRLENYKKYDILYISEYRNVRNYHHDFQLTVFNVVKKFCKINNLKLGIAFNSLRKDKSLTLYDEHKFLNSYKIDNDLSGSYKKASLSKVIISLHSNLGLELLAHKYKVCFFSTIRFPFFDDPDGPFWRTSLPIKNIETVIKWVYDINKLEWDSYLYSNHRDLLTGDPQNKVMNQLLFDS